MHLLWKLRDLLDIINGTGKVDVTDTFYQYFKKLLTFSQLYDFEKYHKEYCYNQNIPHSLCEIYENCVLLAKGLNTRLLCPLSANTHELIKRFSCNLQEMDWEWIVAPLAVSLKSSSKYNPRTALTRSIKTKVNR